MATNLTSGNDAYIAGEGEIVNGLEGNDQIHIIPVDVDDIFYDPAEIHGNQGNDYLVGSAYRDIIHGDSGNDTIFGGSGEDMLYGGSGDDVIWTGSSYDHLGSQSGDTVWAGSDDDKVHLQFANHGDVVNGGDGTDTLYLYNNNGYINQFSLLAGGSNAGLSAEEFEILKYYGSSASETVEGGNQEDWISGGDGVDLLSGAGGDDWLFGDDGADLINGGTGHDNLRGGEDGDMLFGQNGNDVLYGEDGDDSISDGSGSDLVIAGDGNDTIRTGAGNDTVRAGDGDDKIREEASDFVMGSDFYFIGGDVLKGEAGDDDIEGGSGKDSIFGGIGNDKIDGGSHADVIDGGTGVDVLIGGSSGDTFDFNSVFDSLTGVNRDQIADFAVAAGGGATFVDRIDLSTIDAQSGTDGNQGFSFIGTAGFNAEGQVRAIQSGDDTVVQVNTDGNGGADMAIVLQNFTASTFTLADLIL